MWILNDELLQKLPAEASLKELLQYLSVDRDVEQEKVREAVYKRLQIEMSTVSRPERVRIMTIHGSKGLDAAFVFIPGLENGIIPNSKSLVSAGLIAEQRRVMYVGVTRAKLGCFVSLCQRRLGAQAMRIASTNSVSLAASQFIAEMQSPVVDRTDGLSAAEASQLALEYGHLR
jgi:superfamily I DNA/RNA helicase